MTFFKRSELKSDNGRQRQTTSRHRFPPVTRMCRRGNRDTPPKRIWLGCVLSRLGIQINQRGWPGQ
jgi:hypothetical protein